MVNPVCPRDSAHGEMMRNGVRAGKQQWLCNTCGKTQTTKKETRKNE